MDELLNYFMQANREEGLADFEQRARYQTWLNRAFGMMLVEQNLLSKEDYQKIDRGLVSVQARETMERFKNAAPGMDIYFYYENALYEEIGMDTACKLHVGRSRNDIYFTLWRMSLREAALHLMEEAVETQKAIEKHASENLDTIIPFYTYGQPAQPGTWAHYLMTIHAYLESDLERLRHAYATINKCPMGAAAGIGTAFHLNKYRVAELLGFDGTLENTTVANAAADYFLELISDMAILNTTLGRVGSDLAFFSSAECNILDGDAAVCSGSSIMPQKKNYDPGSTLRSRASHFYSYLSDAMTSAGSVTMFPDHTIFDYYPAFSKNLENVVGSMKILRMALDHTKIRKDVAYLRARDGFTAATHMAEQLTMEVGEPFVKTHHIVGNMIHTLMDEDRLRVENMTPELMKQSSVKMLGIEVDRTQEQINNMLDPLASLNAAVTGGTPKPADTQKLLDDGQAVRIQNEVWLKAARKHLADAYETVDKGL